MPRNREMATDTQTDDYIDLCWKLRRRGLDIGEIASLVGVHRNTMGKRMNRALPIPYEAYLAMRHVVERRSGV